MSDNEKWDLLVEEAKKVLSSIRMKQERGEYIGSFACYGYKKDPNDKHHLIIDEEAANVVKKIYQKLYYDTYCCLHQRTMYSCVCQ